MKPSREHATHNSQTYFVTFNTWGRRALFRNERDAADYDLHVHYISNNPVKRHLCDQAEDYPYCSAFPGWKLDPIPQRLKPESSLATDGTAEAMPFQSKVNQTAEAMPCQNEFEAEDVEIELKPQPK